MFSENKVFFIIKSTFFAEGGGGCQEKRTFCYTCENVDSYEQPLNDPSTYHSEYKTYLDKTLSIWKHTQNDMTFDLYTILTSQDLQSRILLIGSCTATCTNLWAEVRI